MEGCFGSNVRKLLRLFEKLHVIVGGGSYLGMAPGFSGMEISVHPWSSRADELRSNWTIIIETGCPVQERN